MERQRVVHYAKRRTARVLEPGCTSRAQSSSPILAVDSPHAPLASIDSDLVVITKRRDRTNMAPNLWEQIGKASSDVSVSGVQTVDTESTILDFADSLTDQHKNTQPRTYVKLRSYQTLEFKTTGFGVKNNRNLNSLPNRHQFHQKPPPPAVADNRTSSAQMPSIPYRSGSLPRDTVSHQKHASFHTQGESSERKEHVLVNGVASVSKNTDDHTKQSPSEVMNLQSSGTRFLEDGRRTSPSIVRLSPDVRLEDISIRTTHGAHSRRSHSKNVGSAAVPDNRYENIKPGHNIPKPRAVLGETASRETKNFENMKIKSQFSVDLPETISPLKCIDAAADSSQERAIFPSEVSSTNKQTIAERSARLHAHHFSKSVDIINNPVLSGSATPCSTETYVDKVPLDNSWHPTRQIPKGFLNKQTAGDHDLSDTVEHGPPPAECTDNTLDSNRKSSWKRNSMMLATHGRTSMSDLAGSFECLATQTAERLKSDRNPSSFRDTKCSRKAVNAREISENAQQNYLSLHNKDNSSDNLHVSAESRKQGNKSISSLDSKTFKQSADAAERGSSVQQFTFRLAALGIGDVWILQKDVCDSSPSSNIPGGSESSKSNSASCTAGNPREREYHTKKTSKMSNFPDRSATVSSNIGHQNFHVQDHQNFHLEDHQNFHAQDYQSFRLEDLNNEEQLKNFKRYSFKMATSSLSEFTFSDDEVKVDVNEYCPNVNVKTERSDLRDLSFRSDSSGVFTTPKSGSGRLRNDSFSCGQNSSDGSYHSCESGDFTKTRTPQEDGRKRQLSIIGTLRRTLVSQDSRESDDSLSYFTATDTSFLTADGASRSSPRMNQTTQWPQRSNSSCQYGSSPRNSHQKPVLSQEKVKNVSQKAASLPQRGRFSKPSKPVSVLQCYSCSLDDEISHQLQLRRQGKSSGLIFDRSWVKPDYAHGLSSATCKRSRSAPGIRRSQTKHSNTSSKRSDTSSKRSDTSSKHSDTSSKHSDTSSKQFGVSFKHLNSVSRQACTKGNIPRNDQPSSSSVHGSSVSSSRDVLSDPQMMTMPRLPPSLGRPRRKLYAGFDSQPLPMDSFLSDSSSVYSTQSYSSWGTSKSATVESRSRTPDISTNVRSRSSTASSAITPTAPLTQDTVFNFFSYSDKRSSLCANNHNFYLSRENSCVEDCAKDNFYEKTFSNESLQSFLSDGTTVESDNIFKKDIVDYAEPYLNSGNCVLLNNGAFVGSKKQSMESRQLKRLSNSCSSEFGSRLCNNSNYFTTAGMGNNKARRSKIKASFSVSVPRPKFLTKRKYFSTKDILELVLASEKNSQPRTRSLQRGLNN